MSCGPSDIWADRRQAVASAAQPDARPGVMRSTIPFPALKSAFLAYPNEVPSGSRRCSCYVLIGLRCERNRSSRACSHSRRCRDRVERGAGCLPRRVSLVCDFSVRYQYTTKSGPCQVPSLSASGWRGRGTLSWRAVSTSQIARKLVSPLEWLLSDPALNEPLRNEQLRVGCRRRCSAQSWP